ncbi:hypothetical protein PG997_006699 [Apiospora hydei]|uniref:Uncharacterized protein n=1 Tax=Apiospora hydei TaxID=1337664 RepID=A0ABR1WS36_9PEZI
MTDGEIFPVRALRPEEKQRRLEQPRGVSHDEQQQQEERNASNIRNQVSSAVGETVRPGTQQWDAFRSATAVQKQGQVDGEPVVTGGGGMEEGFAGEGGR